MSETPGYRIEGPVHLSFLKGNTFSLTIAKLTDHLPCAECYAWGLMTMISFDPHNHLLILMLWMVAPELREA